MRDWRRGVRIREGGKDAVKSRVHSRSPFSVCFGLKRGRSCGAECMPSGERGLWKRDEGGCGWCGSGPGCHSAVLYKFIPDTESGPKTRAVERLSFLNLYLNLHVCCTKWHRIKAQPEMCCNQKVCES